MPADVVHVDLSEASKALAVLGGFIVIYGLISYVVKERLYLSEPLLAVTVGILVGPYALNWVDPLSWGTTEETNELTYQFTRIVVGIQVLFTGISLPKAYLWKEKLSLSVLLFGIMTTAWFTTALLIWGLIPNLTYLESLAIAAAVTPTDPVLANSITSGRYAEEHVPANVRNIILAESGANDGLGFPFLYLGIYLLARNGEDANTSVGTEVGRWVYAVVIYQILLSIIFGSLLGYLARKTLRWAESRSYIDKANFFAYGLGLAFFTLGTTGLFGSDDILACFIAGNSFTWDDWFRVRTEDNDFQEIIDSVLNMAVFVYIGAIIPWADYSNPVLELTGWRVVVLAILVLLLRRPPWVIAATRVIPALRNFKESAFAGWFGPIGVGAVFYIQVALRQLPDDGTRDRLREVYTPVVLFCVFGSVLTHGITIPISKLGPGVMRRTATLTKTRSITFSRPVSRSNTIQPPSSAESSGEPSDLPDSDSSAVEGSPQTGAYPAKVSRGHVGFNDEGKVLWNPLLAVGEWAIHVFAFWRKDSFWRKEVQQHTDATGHHHFSHQRTGPIEKANISAPSRPTRQKTVDQLQLEEQDIADANTVELSEAERTKSRLPPPSLELPTVSRGPRRSPSPPTAATTASAIGTTTPSASPAVGATAPTSPDIASPPMPALERTISPSGRFGNLRRALDRELDQERKEAQSEAQRGWEKGKLKEQRRLRDILLRSQADNQAHNANPSTTSNITDINTIANTNTDVRSHGDSDGLTNQSADRPGTANQDDSASTHSSQRRTLRFV
ncbi:hypothetical protein BCV70DRAFT_201833 [Testicularia cyperi]|uniref:Cation/H+ exchanger transmembrane domain-containing protein n=1 Tax=Testicularia cyperi TaxID=1882483 RepID=A0A317XJP4_9BASI|nr:hypothetical protein BCV70DRAFT_201833 [Testicularia cyperi]